MKKFKMKNKIKFLVIITSLVFSAAIKAMENTPTTSKINLNNSINNQTTKNQNIDNKILENNSIKKPKKSHTIRKIKNSDYDIGPIPKDKKLGIENNDSIHRILYNRENNKYCYQLDYNTFILLDEKEYLNNKTLFNIKDKRLLFKVILDIQKAEKKWPSHIKSIIPHLNTIFGREQS